VALTFAPVLAEDDELADFDVVIAGAGPAGLSAGISLSRLGLRVALVERQSAAALADPGFDGRDIALTGASRQILAELGAWQHFAPEEISPIDRARVSDGDGPGLLRFDLPASRQDALGYLVSNHVAASAQPGITLLDGQQVTAARAAAGEARIALADGRQLTATLLLAADSRFSEVRRMMGITADTTPYGKTMHVFRMRHDKPHRQTAFECFNYGHTLALLPLNGLRSSVVLTVKTSHSDAIGKLGDDALADLVTRGFGRRFGDMTLESTRHVYPLVGVYARRFAGERFALIGDAAVGMHPVTAHGFNFGLEGQATLSELIAAAHMVGGDIGASGLLERYESRHKRATWPLYFGTNAIVRLYTNDAPPARLARSALLAVADRFSPAKRLIMARLGETAPHGAARFG
jgi:ubiquinone biosynthesis UbiH/UbiF/VisC/COQ6 family hydroxylase